MADVIKHAAEIRNINPNIMAVQLLMKYSFFNPEFFIIIKLFDFPAPEINKFLFPGKSILFLIIVSQ